MSAEHYLFKTNRSELCTAIVVHLTKKFVRKLIILIKISSLGEIDFTITNYVLRSLQLLGSIIVIKHLTLVGLILNFIINNNSSFT